MCIAAGIVGGAVVSGVASGIGASKQARAAGKAADAQAQAAQDSIAFQRESRDLARRDLAPFINFATGQNRMGGQPLIGQPLAESEANFDANAYLLANPDVARAKGYGSQPYLHYLQHGKAEGRAFTPTQEAQTQGAYGSYAADSPLGQLEDILSIEGQSNYLKNNPLFTLALDNLNQRSNNTFLGRGRVGSANNQLVNNAFLAGTPLLQNQTQNLFNAVNIGQASAAGQANNALLAGQGIANSIEGMGNAQAAGYIGQGNAAAQGLYGIGNAAGQAAGAYAWYNRPTGAVNSGGMPWAGPDQPLFGNVA